MGRESGSVRRLPGTRGGRRGRRPGKTVTQPGGSAELPARRGGDSTPGPGAPGRSPAKRPGPGPPHPLRPRRTYAGGRRMPSGQAPQGRRVAEEVSDRPARSRSSARKCARQRSPSSRCAYAPVTSRTTAARSWRAGRCGRGAGWIRRRLTARRPSRRSSSRGRAGTRRAGKVWGRGDQARTHSPRCVRSDPTPRPRESRSRGCRCLR